MKTGCPGEASCCVCCCRLAVVMAMGIGRVGMVMCMGMGIVVISEMTYGVEGQVGLHDAQCLHRCCMGRVSLQQCAESLGSLLKAAYLQLSNT